MTTPSTTTPYDWLKSVEPRLVSRRKIAIVESPEAFSWASLAEALAHHFEIASLQLHPSAPAWLTEAEDKQASATPSTSLRYAIGDLPGEVHWVIGTEAATQLMTDLLTGDSGHVAVEDPAFLTGFLHYVAAETIQQLLPLGFEQELTPKFLGQITPAQFEGKRLAIDIQVAVFNRSYATRLLISAPLAAAWKQYFIRLHRRQELSPELASQTEITAHLESGRVTLSQRQWSDLEEGDFLLLDSSTVTPGLDKGRVMLTVGGVPLFRCMLKPGQIKLLEHPLYHEVETPMSDTNDHDDEVLEDDESYTEESEDESEETETDESAFDDEELTEDEDSEDGEDEADEETETAEEEEEHTEGEETEAEAEAPARELTPADKIPLHIVVEVGRLKMSLSQLRDLQPGQLLDIDVKPEEGVDLVVSGVCIGRGELLRMGETLGVRILELG